MRLVRINQQGLEIDHRIETLNSNLQNWNNDVLWLIKRKSEKSDLWAKVVFFLSH